MVAPPSGVAVAVTTTSPPAGDVAAGGRARTASTALASTFTSADRDHRARRLSRRHRGGCGPADLREIRGCQVEPERPGKVEHVVDDPVQAIHLLVDVGS